MSIMLYYLSLVRAVSIGSLIECVVTLVALDQAYVAAAPSTSLSAHVAITEKALPLFECQLLTPLRLLCSLCCAAERSQCAGMCHTNARHSLPQRRDERVPAATPGPVEPHMAPYSDSGKDGWLVSLTRCCC